MTNPKMKLGSAEPKLPGSIESRVNVTLDMITAGQEAYYSFDPTRDDPEVMIFQIIYRTLELAERDKQMQTKARAPFL